MSRSLVTSLVLTSLTTTALGDAGRRISVDEAHRRRGELVRLTGPVSEVQDRAEGFVLRVGGPPGVPLLVPASALRRFKLDLSTLHRREVQVTGFITPPDGPLAIVIERPEQLALVPSAPPAPTTEERLAARVRALETELERAQSALPRGGTSGITYGPLRRPLPPLPRYPLQAAVLAQQGVPSRVEWGPRRRILHYGRHRWSFDETGQLIDIERR
jgi:hypothetical protein